MKLNLGCGKLPIKNCVNVDFVKSPIVDEVVDLSKYPWPWKNSSIDEIFCLHFFEHVNDPMAFVVECKRVLRKKGRLIIKVPFWGGLYAIPQTDHITNCGFMTFQNSFFQDTYINKFQAPFKKIKFKYQYLYAFDKEPYIPYKSGFKLRPLWFRALFFIPYRMVDFIINLSPFFYEKILFHYVGGADEIVVIAEVKK